jgi:PAS domain S-box-containing protein
MGVASAWGDVISALPTPIMTARPNGRIDYWNRQWVQYSGGTTVSSLECLIARIVSEDRERFSKAWKAGTRGKDRFAIEVRVVRRDGAVRWQRFLVDPVLRDDGILVKWLLTIVDLHEIVEARKAAEEASRRLRVLSELSSALHQTLDPLEIARVACRHAAPVVDGEAVLSFRLFEESVVVRYPDGSKQASPIRFAVPLVAHNRELGQLLLAFPEDRAIDSLDRELLDELADRVALALDNARMYANERRISTAMQARLLPAQLHEPYGVRVDAVYLPCDDDMRIGGDWYDSFELHDGRLAVTMGDVAGHGATAAALMGTLREAIRAALLGGSSPREALGLANGVVFGGDPGMATAFAAAIDPVEMTMKAASAGHPAPFLAYGGAATLLEGCGPPLGVFDRLQLVDVERQLPGRCALVFFTDGMIEYGHDAVAGLEALRAAVERWSDDGTNLDARRLSTMVLGTRPRTDDAAMLLVRFAPVTMLDLTIKAVPSQSEVGRRALMRFARGCGLDRERASDLVLASCEAMNNAIEHAYSEESGAVRLRARRNGDELVVTVDDNGRWSDRPPHADRGRGLVIIGALSDEMEICRRDNGTSVHVGFRLDATPLSKPAPVKAG